MASANGRRIKVGDRVQLRLGQRVVRAKVIEDRGCIGKDGRRLLRIRRGRLESKKEYEVPADDLELIDFLLPGNSTIY